MPRRHVGVCGEGNVLDGLGFAGRAFDEEFAGLPVQILFAALQQMSGNLFGLIADLTRRHGGSRAGDGCAAAGVGSQAIGSGVGVALLHGHIGCRNSQLLSDDLRIGSLMPLSLALGSHAAHGLARGMNANLAAVEHLDAGDVEGMGRPGADSFHEAGNTDAHQLALFALLLLLLRSAS
jgi:hypothetical protein